MQHRSDDIKAATFSEVDRYLKKKGGSGGGPQGEDSFLERINEKVSDLTIAYRKSADNILINRAHSLREQYADALDPNNYRRDYTAELNEFEVRNDKLSEALTGIRRGGVSGVVTAMYVKLGLA